MVSPQKTTDVEISYVDLRMQDEDMTCSWIFSQSTDANSKHCCELQVNACLNNVAGGDFYQRNGDAEMKDSWSLQHLIHGQLGRSWMTSACQ